MRFRGICLSLLWLAMGVLLAVLLMLIDRIERLEEKLDGFSKPIIHYPKGDR